MSYEFAINGGDPDRIRAGLLTAAHDHAGMDVAIQPQGLSRRAKRLVVLDVDSTLITDEVVDVLAAEAGVGDQVAAITERAMAGELDFADVAHRTCRAARRARRGRRRPRLAVPDAHAGRPHVLSHPASSRLHDGDRVSGGFTIFTERLRRRLEIPFAWRTSSRSSTGTSPAACSAPSSTAPPRPSTCATSPTLEGMPIEQTVAVGDGANDLDMLAAAGLGIAFNAKPVVRAAADTALRVPYLDAVLFLLGVSREEIEAADADPRS